MKNRYEKFVHEDERSIPFEAKSKKGTILNASDGTDDESIIKDLKIANNNVHIDDYIYMYPPIPEGYVHVLGEWNNGFVIERSLDESQFVWVPVGSLDADGTLDGITFTEKFGRRNYLRNEFTKKEFHEKLDEELALQYESVKKYGGFYISRYNISKSKNTGKPQSVKGVMPLTNINFYEAMSVAANIEASSNVTSHLPYGAEYDSVLAWFIKSGARTVGEITKNSNPWGNHWNIFNSPKAVIETGSRKEWRTNNIYDFAGNVSEWTQEQNGKPFRVIRGGDYEVAGNRYPVAIRIFSYPIGGYACTGFRATLYIK